MFIKIQLRDSDGLGQTGSMKMMRSSQIMDLLGLGDTINMAEIGLGILCEIEEKNDLDVFSHRNQKYGVAIIKGLLSVEQALQE